MSDFVLFARAHGLRLDHAVPDGRWRRVRTESKPRKFNGAYLYDGVRGVVRDWATMDRFAVFKPEGSEAIKIDRAELRRTMLCARKAEAERHAKAAAEAARIVKASTLLTPSPAVPARAWRAGKEAVLAHPYLVRKGLGDVPGLVHEGFLIVPMRVRGEHCDELVNVQRISPEGEKRFLAGGRAKDAVHRIGPPRAREVWLTEGYATALSLMKALKGIYREAAVVVCFSAGNLRYPGATHVMADHDESGAGARAAEATGLPWVMPTEVGMDANDVHARHGLKALQELVRQVGQ